MISNETNLHKRQNNTEMNSYRSPYGLQQSENPIRHSQRYKDTKHNPPPPGTCSGVTVQHKNKLFLKRKTCSLCL